MVLNKTFKKQHDLSKLKKIRVKNKSQNDAVIEKCEITVEKSTLDEIKGNREKNKSKIKRIKMSGLELPVPLAEVEIVLAWVDGFKLSRPTKKINRDFSDAVLLAEILYSHYPKLVEMHNYPPRNSHALKLNNWLTLNRKVLKKLKLNLCGNTMDQLANAAPGLIERILIMVRDKINRDEELNKSVKEADQNVSSGGSYYEACGGEENVLVVPVKTRVNGVLETVQQKVVNYEFYQSVKEELKDAKDATERLKQKVEHLDSLLKQKEERIDGLQKQLDRKQARRKEAEAYQNSISAPFERVPSPVPADVFLVSRKSSGKSAKSNIKTAVSNTEVTLQRSVESSTKIALSKSEQSVSKSGSHNKIATAKTEESKIPVPIGSMEPANEKPVSKPRTTEISSEVQVERIKSDVSVDRIKSDVFQEVELVDIMQSHITSITHSPKNMDGDVGNDNADECTDKSPKDEEFKGVPRIVITIEETIDNEIIEITSPHVVESDLNYII